MTCFNLITVWFTVLIFVQTYLALCIVKMPDPTEAARILEIEGQITALKAKVEELSERINPDMDEEQKKEIQTVIEQHHKEMLTLMRTLEELQSSPTTDVRRSGRERRPTEKGLEYRKEEVQRQTKAFHRAYVQWKGEAKASRTMLKDFCTDEMLNQIKSKLEDGHSFTLQCCNSLGNICTPSQDVVEKWIPVAH